jgi:ABC-type lipoprotein export system ATPase subunit
MITLRNIEKCYKTGAGMTYVLRQINIDIAEGEFVTIMGPSGAGKTTLLNILGMLDGDWEGQYHLMDQPVHELKPRDRLALNKKYVGFVFQSFNLLDTLTVYENLEVPLSYRNVKASQRAGIVCDTLDRFGIVGKKGLFPSQLSGGQQQLVGVARAVIADPKLILADEPTGNLHSSQGEEVMQLLARLNREGTTIVQVTHNDKYAAYGTRIIKLKDGWLDGEITPARRAGKGT